MTVVLPTFEDVVAAASRIGPHIVRTPVMRSDAFDARSGRRVFFKCENLQTGGAFKYRGAMNTILQIDPERTPRVITHSSGDLHWDHGLVNRATVSALRRTPCDLLAFLSSPEMNAQSRAIGQCFADISSTMETKIAAIKAHESQVSKLDLDSSRDLARAMGRISGYQYAEVYEALRVRV